MPRTISKIEVRQNVNDLNQSPGSPDLCTEEFPVAEPAPEFEIKWDKRDRDRNGNYWTFACDAVGLVLTPNRSLQALNFDGKNPGGEPRYDSEWLLLAFGKIIGRGDLGDLKRNALKYLKQ